MGAERELEGVEIVYDDGRNAIVRKDSVFVYVRRGAMSMESIELLTATWRSVRRTSTGEVGGLFVLEPSAPLAPPDVRARQRELLREMIRDGRVRGVVVIEGEGVEATAKRSVARLLSIGWRNLQIVSDLGTGVKALAKAMGSDGMVVRALAEEARARLDRAPRSTR